MISEHVQLNSLGDQIYGRLFLPEASKKLPVVIFVHGAIDYKEHFFDLAAYFVDQGFAALVLDMHGHGESEGERYHVRMDQWVPDVKMAIDFLQSHPKIDKSRIGAFGFSSGGSAILETAASDDRLVSLVTLDATVCPIVSKIEQIAFKLLCKLGNFRRRHSGKDLYLPLYGIAKQQKLACDQSINQMYLDDPYIIKGYQRYPIPGAVESFVIDTLDRVSAVKCPTCVIHGAEDDIDKPSSAKKLFSRLSCIKSLHIIPGSGHVGHMDLQKETVKEIARDWFAKYL